MARCIILNADHTFLNVVSVKKAFKMVAKGKVEVLKYSEKIFKTIDATFKIPLVMKLVKLIRTLYRSKVPYSKRAVIIRDGFACAYCGATPSKLTIDHVIPRSKGGKTSFENCVAACKPCNNKKEDKTCSEAKMYMRVKPVAPTVMEFIRKKMEQLGIEEILKELYI